MFFELPQKLILMSAGAFLLGWVLSWICSRTVAGLQVRQRDPRDNRIRSLEAELRIAQTDAGKAKENLAQLTAELKEAQEGIEKRDNVIAHQQVKVDQATHDLKESVKKTRELRAELSDRATESVKSEVKLREVETELEVQQASTDLIATGVLDYSLAAELELADNADADVDDMTGRVSKTAT